MLASLALLAAAGLGGIAITFGYDRRTPFAWRILHGACIGLAALGVVGFALASAFGFSPWTPWLAAAILVLPPVLVLGPGWRARVDQDPTIVASTRLGTAAGSAAILGCAGGAALLWRASMRTAFTTPDGLYTGVANNIGDLPFHLAVMSRFVLGENYPPRHPSFAGAGFSYPYITDFTGGLFTVTGLKAESLIAWSTFLFVAILAALLYRWTLSLTGNRSAALLAPFIALMSGGLGWSMFLEEAWTSDRGALAYLQHLPHDYTITFDGRYRWGNLVTTLLIPQRGLLLGLPLAIIVFQHWWDAAHGGLDEREKVKVMAGAGLVAGLLPLVHAHGFAVVCAVAAWFMVFSPARKHWTAFFAVAGLLALPQLWWATRGSGIRGDAFIGWAFGWDHGTQNVVSFWLMNTGFFIPLIALGFMWRGGAAFTPSLIRFYLPFVLCFVVPNTLRLAPWIWDNIKVLTFWFVASVPLVALVLARIGHGGFWRRTAAGLLLLTLTAAGALDIWRIASGAFENRVFDAAGLAFAEQVARATSPSAVVLHAPVHNHPLVMSGRQSFMGYAGHVWSHGLDAGSRPADIRRIYAGDPGADALIRQYGIEFVVVGPRERLEGPVDDNYFSRYRVVADTGGYRLYDTRHAN